jgi:hypothetical protein
MRPGVRSGVAALLLALAGLVCAQAQIVDFQNERTSMVEIHDLWRFHTGDYLYAAADPVNLLDPRGREELGEEAGAIADAEAAVEETTNSLKTLMEYRLDLLKQRGYEINTEGTERFADEILDDFIKMWDNK